MNISTPRPKGCTPSPVGDGIRVALLTAPTTLVVEIGDYARAEALPRRLAQRSAGTVALLVDVLDAGSPGPGPRGAPEPFGPERLLLDHLTAATWRPRHLLAQALTRAAEVDQPDMARADYFTAVEAAFSLVVRERRAIKHAEQAGSVADLVDSVDSFPLWVAVCAAARHLGTTPTYQWPPGLVVPTGGAS